MAAAHHRPQKPNMLRRILSPRDQKKSDNKTRTSSMSDMNGLRRDDELQGSMEIENTVYRDPELIHQQYPPSPPMGPGPGGFRSQSMVVSPVDASNPPLPPRNNRPVSFSNHPLQRKQSNDPDDPSALYVEPANTLRSAAASNYTQVEPSDAHPTRQDIKQMTMYRQTMEQSMEHTSGRGHRRVRSFGHVIDKSEYSTPFDLLQGNEKARQRGEAVLPVSVRAQLNHPQRSASETSKPPPKPKRIRQIDPSSSADPDNVIPLVPSGPTPPGHFDRSHTNSPCSPHSTNSSEQELIRDDGTNDYDEPWDQKFKDLSRMRAATSSTRSDSHLPPSRHHLHSEQHFNDRVSPPSPNPFERPQRPTRERNQASVSPEIPTESNSRAFMRGTGERSSGRRDNNSSPVSYGRDGRSYSTPQAPHAAHSPRFDHIEPALRTSSISMAKRLLPPTPNERPGERWLVNREPSPPPAVIDISIPIQDQPWYHGSITRSQAENLLRDQPDFSFLVRDSESNNTNYSLSIRDYTSGFIHLRVIKENGPNGGYVLGQFSGNFGTVQECIGFYTKTKLNIRNADHKRLGLPIPRPNHMAKYRM